MNDKQKYDAQNNKKNYSQDVLTKYGLYWFSWVSLGIPTQYGNIQT
jgi:succinate-acetate transporter protein